MRISNCINFTLLLMGSVFSACNHDSGGTDVFDENATLCVLVQASDTVAKSSANSRISATRSFSETSVSDLHVLICNGTGEVTGHAYSLGNSISNVSTRSGSGCTVYAITNTGSENIFSAGILPATEQAIRTLVTKDLTSLDEISANDVLLMTGQVKTDIVPGSNSISSLSVSRLAARNILKITCADNIILTGYAIGNLPVRSWFIAHPNTNEGTPSDAVVGDDAVSPSIDANWLNTAILPASAIVTGSTPQYALTFYMYENRRGGRKVINGSTGDATSQTQKAIYAPNRATYVDLFVNANGVNVTYRLYLGADNSKNYNVKRNGSYTYTITIGSTNMNVGGVVVESWSSMGGGEIEF